MCVFEVISDSCYQLCFLTVLVPPPSLISAWFMIKFYTPKQQFVRKMIFREYCLVHMMIETGLEPGIVGQGCRFPQAWVL